jgi:hypothetical protein
VRTVLCRGCAKRDDHNRIGAQHVFGLDPVMNDNRVERQATTSKGALLEELTRAGDEIARLRPRVGRVRMTCEAA